MKSYDRLNPPQSIKSSLLLVFTLCIRSSSSLAPLYLKSSPLFGSTSTRDVLGGLPTPRHTLRSLLPDRVYDLFSPTGSLPGGEIQVYCEEEDHLRHREPSEPQARTVQTYTEEESLLRQVADRPTLCRGPSAPPQRVPPGGPF
jgi:hypothetical protein